MVINEMRLPVRELVEGYKEDAATGRVTAWGGKLDVRPEFQREFVYDAKQQSAVINTVMHGFPLNIMYFVDRKDGTYEVLDGQQRIISICKYVTNLKRPAPIQFWIGADLLCQGLNLMTLHEKVPSSALFLARKPRK